VFEVQPPLTMRWQTVFNGLQGVFWSGIYGVHFVAPEAVELWWGALGMAVTIGWQAMLYFRAHRSVNELAVVSRHAEGKRQLKHTSHSISTRILPFSLFCMCSSFSIPVVPCIV
jgi:hypothetical protein